MQKKKTQGKRNTTIIDKDVFAQISSHVTNAQQVPATMNE
jgi:hypothetical protein